MSSTRDIIEIDEDLCDGCGQCIIDCAENALKIINGKAKIISDNLCDGFGTCVKGCPKNAMKIIQRKADPFDLVAVSENSNKLASQNTPLEHQSSSTTHTALGAPLLLPINTISMEKPSGQNWPVKLRLLKSIPEHADILLTADCAAPVTPSFYDEYAKGKIVITVCPKFEDNKEVTANLANLFKHSPPKSVTTIQMEVPCCKGVSALAKNALEIAGLETKLSSIIMSRQGQAIEQVPTMHGCCGK